MSRFGAHPDRVLYRQFLSTEEARLLPFRLFWGRQIPPFFEEHRVRCCGCCRREV